MNKNRSNPPIGEDGQHATFCRLCESFCGMVATVRDGQIVSVVPDKENPHSQGHICVKGVGMAKITHDPERVTTPLKRVGGPGEFAPVSWDEALDDIAARLVSIRAEHGGEAIASYLGNPTAFSTNAFMTFNEFMAACGSVKPYGSGSQDSNARMTANYMLYGAPALFGVTDMFNCEFLLILGANPLVSNGWMMYMPGLHRRLDAIAKRGRVVVVDPRLTETAQRYEHIAIRPNSDVWLLLGMLRTLIDAGRIDPALVDEIAIGWDTLVERIADVTLAEAAWRTGLPAQAIAKLAHDFADAPRAAIYGGLGLCRGDFGTLGAFLLSTLNAVTGKYGVEGGVVFSRQALAGPNRQTVGGYGDSHTRIGHVPTIAGFMASAMLPADIEEPGEGQVRALVMLCGNPVLSAPGGERLEQALQKLDLLVSFDIYHNESNRYADYILPSTTFFERPDWPFIGLNVLLPPFLQYTDAVIKPVGEAREEYQVFHDLGRRMGMAAPSASKAKQRMARLGLLPTPVQMIDIALRMGPVGDWFGLRSKGWSLKKLRKHPHGVLVEGMKNGATGWRDRLAYTDGKLRLWHDLIAPEFDRLFATRETATPTLTLIGRRDIRSMNSWMHNIDKLVRSQEALLMVNPADAGRHGVKSGDRVRIWNENGEVEVAVEVSEEIVAGTVSYPHGWGHAAGWERANRTTGGNINALLGLGVESIEFVSGMTLMDCTPVSMERVAAIREAVAEPAAISAG